MLCGIQIIFFLNLFLLNLTFTCSQNEPEMRMIVWKKDADQTLDTSAQKKRKKTDQSKLLKYRAPIDRSFSRYHFNSRAIEEHLLRRFDSLININEGHSSQKPETRVRLSHKKRAGYAATLAAHEIVDKSQAENKEDGEIEASGKFLQPSRVFIDPRYWIDIFRFKQAFVEERDIPVVKGKGVQSADLKEAHFQDSNSVIFLRPDNVSFAAKHERLKLAIRVNLLMGDEALPITSFLYLNNDLHFDTPIEQAWTGLHFACSKGAVKSATFFMQRNANINARGPGKMTPLMCAVENNRLPVALLLLRDGALRINLRDEHGETALVKAVNRGSWQMVNALVLAKANVLIPDSNNDTPLNIARKHLAKQQADLLKRLKADDDSDSDSEDDCRQINRLIQSYGIMITQLKITEDDQLKIALEKELKYKLAKENGFVILPKQTSLTRSSNNASCLCDSHEATRESWRAFVMWHIKAWFDTVIS